MTYDSKTVSDHALTAEYVADHFVRARLYPGDAAYHLSTGLDALGNRTRNEKGNRLLLHLAVPASAVDRLAGEIRTTRFTLPEIHATDAECALIGEGLDAAEALARSLVLPVNHRGTGALEYQDLRAMARQAQMAAFSASLKGAHAHLVALPEKFPGHHKVAEHHMMARLRRIAGEIWALQEEIEAREWQRSAPVAASLWNEFIRARAR